MADDQSQFEIVQVGGPEGNTAAAFVACYPSTPYSAAATNLQTALNETADFILALAAQPRFQGGLGHNEAIPSGAYSVGDYWIFRDGGNRTVNPADPNIEAGDWAIYTKDSVWVILNYSFLNVLAQNVPYDPAVGDPTNVAAALDSQAADIAANSGVTAKVEFTEYDSIQDVRNKTGNAIEIYVPTDNSILTTNLRTTITAMPNESVLTTVVGDANSQGYYLTGIAYGTLQLWRMSYTRAFGQFFSKENSLVYTVSFDPSATTEIFYKVTPTYDAIGEWANNQTFNRRVEVGNTFSGGTTASLIVTNTNSGAAVPLISAVSANGTERWLVDNGGHTTQGGDADIGGNATIGGGATIDGSVEMGDSFSSGEVATLSISNGNKQGKLIDCYDNDGLRIFFVKNAQGSANMQITGPNASFYSQGNITAGGNINAGGTLMVGGKWVQPEKYLTKDGGDYLKVGTAGTNNASDVTTGYAHLQYNMGNNSQGTLILYTAEQSYNDLWLNCYSDGNGAIKLRSSGWGSFSGGTDKDTSYANTVYAGERYDGTQYNDASKPALTVRNASTANNALTMAVKDHAGNNSLEVSTKGHIKMDGADCRLDLDGDLWNSGHDIHTSTLNCGIMNANLAEPYTCNVGGNHTVGGTLTVQGHVVSSSLELGGTDVLAKLANIEQRLEALEGIDINAINTLIQTIMQSDN